MNFNCDSVRAIEEIIIEQTDCFVAELTDDPFNPHKRKPPIAFDKMPLNKVFEFNSWQLLNESNDYSYEKDYSVIADHELSEQIDNIQLLCA